MIFEKNLAAFLIMGLYVYLTFGLEGHQSDHEIAYHKSFDGGQPNENISAGASPSSLIGYRAPDPGGVGDSLVLWLMADTLNGRLELFGNEVTHWRDTSGNNHDASNVLSDRPTLSSNLINFNNAVNFDETNSSYLDLGAYASNILTKDNAFFIVSNNLNTNNDDILFYGSNGTGNDYNGFGGNLGVYEFHLHRSADADARSRMFVQDSLPHPATITNNGEAIGDANTIARLTSAYYKAGDSLGVSGNGHPYVTSLGVPSSIIVPSELFLGKHGHSDPVRYLTGDVAEILVYKKHDLDQTDRDKIESYLAVKYGVTLDKNRGSSTENFIYLDSDGDTIWNGNDPGYQTYHHGVAGIGRDDSTALHQKQSKSGLEDSDLVMAIGQLSATNSANPNNLTHKDFLMWGHDDGSVDTLDAVTDDVPITVAKRLERVWRVKNTNNVRDVTVAFPADGLDIGSVLDFQLIVSETPNMSEGRTYRANSINTIGGIPYILFEGRNQDPGEELKDGNYISIGFRKTNNAAPDVSPGGVAADLDLWLKADVGGFKTPLTTWLDLSFSGRHAGNYSGAGEPTLSGNTINFNPAIAFDESDSTYLEIHEHASDIFRRTTSNSIYIVSAAAGSGFEITFYASNDTSSDYNGLGLGGNNMEFHLHHNFGGTSNGVFLQDGSGITGVANESPGFSTDPMLTSSFLHSDWNIEVGQNGHGTASASLFGPANVTANYLFLGRHGSDATVDRSRFLTGDIAEVIVYGADYRSATQDQRIESYLAIKYGITLDNDRTFDGINYDYLNSNSDVIWPGTTDTDYQTYHHDVAGIGRDDNSALLQKQSRSVNTGAILTIGKDTIVSDNAANTNSFDDDLDFFIWGHDNESAAYSERDSTDVPGDVAQRMNRVWRVNNEGAVTTIDLQFDLAGLGYPSLAVNDLQLIVSDYSQMVAGVTYSASGFSGDVVSFDDITITDGQYFSLGFAKSSSAPGGVSDDIALWLKGNDGIYSVNFEVFNWSDKSGNNNHGVLERGSNNQFPPRDFAAVNGNKSVWFEDFDSFDEADASYIRTSKNEVDGNMTLMVVYNTIEAPVSGATHHEKTSSLISANALGTDADYSMGLKKDSLFIKASANDTAFDVLSTVGATGYLNGEPRILTGERVQAVNGEISLYANSNKLEGTGMGGELAVDDPSDNVSLNAAAGFGIGNNYEIDATTGNRGAYEGVISEVIVYGDTLSQDEQNRVESYLAIKYGITRLAEDDGTTPFDERDYRSSNSTVVWDFSASGYNTRIAGVGRDDGSQLNQSRSTSTTFGVDFETQPRVTMEVTGGISADQSFMVWGHDNASMEDEDNREFDLVTQPDISSRLNREWRVQRTGTFGEVKVFFNLDNITNRGASPETDLVLLLSYDDDFSSLSGDPTPVNVTSIVEDGFDTVAEFRVDFSLITQDEMYFTLASREEGTLPIELIAFDATVVDDKVVLDWTTAQEIDNEFFTIERSRDGRHFEILGYVNGAGNSSEVMHYHYVDENPFEGRSYYRLKQTDFNGQFAYSGLRLVEIQSALDKFQISPNPVRKGEPLSVHYSVDALQNIKLHLYSSQGKQIMEKAITLSPDTFSFGVDIGMLNNGLYLLQLLDLEKQQSRWFKVLVK